jgi:hypothetical protein
MSAPLSIINESAFVGGKVELLEEGTTYLGELPRIRFKAKLQEANVVNNNGRSYTPEVLSIIVQQLASKANERKLVGELDHPCPEGDANSNLKRSSTISLANSCVLFTKLEFDGKFIVAECETLTNDAGMNLYRLLKDKVSIGFSLRAFGSSTKSPTGVTMISPVGLKALTFDVVSNPSHSSAVIYEFIEENTSFSSIVKLAKTLKDFNSSDLVHEVILESSFFGDEVKPYDVQGNPYQGCVCSLDGTCVQGTIEESVDFLLGLAMSKSNYKKFNLFLGIN